MVVEHVHTYSDQDIVGTVKQDRSGIVRVPNEEQD